VSKYGFRGPKFGADTTIARPGTDLGGLVDHPTEMEEMPDAPEYGTTSADWDCDEDDGDE
jgi:hypothetical protein